MQMKLLTGTLLLAAGLWTGCGGTETVEAEASMEEAVSQDQSLRPTCPAGSQSAVIWECPLLAAGAPPCRYYYGGYYNEQHLYCSSPGGSWEDAGATGRYAWGEW